MLKYLLLAAALLFSPASADAASATFYIQAAGCTNGNTRCSGTTDSTTETVSGASATITCSATTYTGSTPGCSLRGSPDLSGVATDGSQFIHVECATNTAQKVFRITAVDDGADLVQTGTTPTGCTASTSDWGIGGRKSWPGGSTANVVEGGLQAGDTLQFNDTPATRTAVYFTARNAGSGTNGGFVSFIGKAGETIELTITSGTDNVITGGNLAFLSYRNLTLRHQGSSGTVIGTTGNNSWVDQVRVLQGPGTGMFPQSAVKITRSEFTGLVTGIGLTANNANNLVIAGNYIHDNSGDGLLVSGTASAATIINNIFDTNAGRGIYLNISETAPAGYQLFNNTIYGSGASGLEVSDTDIVANLTNNIFQENGNASGEFNVKWSAGTAQTISFHNNNLFYHSNCEGSASSTTCVSGLTTNSTEVAGSSASFVDAAGGNFALNASSPAKGTGFPGAFAGGTTTGYISMGAAQVQGGTAGIIGGGF